MPAFKASFFALFLAASGMAAIGSAAPVVNLTRSPNIDGSGYDALDFFYASTPGAEFTNYRLNLETTNGAYIFDPDPRQRQNEGSQAIDTFMNTVGSSLGLSDATQVYNAYRPSPHVSPPSAISQIDWSVFDTFTGDSNSIGGGAAPFHLARVLISPQAEWKAAFTAYDTASLGVGAKFNFINNSIPEIEEPFVPPPPPYIPPPVYTPPPAPVVAPPVAPLPNPRPTVSLTRSVNIDGSGYDALDFFYASTPGAEFTNYRLNLETTNGAYIFDPDSMQRQNEGSQAIDTFMNTVGSSLGLSNAAQVYNAYRPSVQSTAPPAISQIDWSVFDTLSGDTNEIAGDGAAPFHLARVLISPDAEWNATFTAFDTSSQGVGTKFKFLNNVIPEIEQPLVTPDIPPAVVPEPSPPAVEPVPPTVVPAPSAPVLPTPPAVNDPPAEEPVFTQPEPTIEEPLVWLPRLPWNEVFQPFDPTTLEHGYHVIHVDEDGEIRILPVDLGDGILRATPVSLTDVYWGNTIAGSVAAEQLVSFRQLLTTDTSLDFAQNGMAFAFGMATGAATSGDPQPTPEPTGAILAAFAAVSLVAFRCRR